MPSLDEDEPLRLSESPTMAAALTWAFGPDNSTPDDEPTAGDHVAAGRPGSTTSEAT